MKQFITFVKKEFIHILRDPRTLLILIGMPIVEMLLFGFALTTEVNHIRTVIFDQSQDARTAQLKAKINANTLYDYYGSVSSMDEIDELFRKDKIELAIVIPPQFDYNVGRRTPADIQLIVDSADPTRGTTAAQYTQAVIASLFEEQQQAVPMVIDINTHMLYNPSMKSAYNFVPGLMGLVMVVICTIMTSVSIAREKEKGTMEVLLVSPIRPTVMIMAKAVPYLVVSFINLASILLLSYFVLRVPIVGSLWLIILLSTLYILVALMLGIFISSIVSTQHEAILISGFAMMMPTMVLGDMLFPITNMPQLLQWLSTIIPGRYYIGSVRQVMIQGANITVVWQDMLILTGMVLFLFIISVRNIKPRLQ